jgi:N-ethylmaleimide reductase
MTRGFAGPEHTATAEMMAYYARRARAGVGLILTEGTIIHPSGDGYHGVPYICADHHVESWRQVTSAVHAAGSRIFCQLWHCGRISHPDFLDGNAPVSSTDRRATGINRQNNEPFGIPRRLEIAEMPLIVEQFRTAARNALRADFDGVELHFGHGYLADQFLDGNVNDRTDAYGGTIEGRCRLPLEIARVVLAECGSDRVMLRISPARWLDGPYEWLDLAPMLHYFVPALDEAGLRMLDISCASANYASNSGRVIRSIRPHWPHFLIGGASLSREDAQQELDSGWLDMVTYGRFLLANPDLVDRLRVGRPLVDFDRAMLARLD